MERVNIPGEAPGSATYYMGLAPEEYGTRLFDMERYGDAELCEALMDIGTQRNELFHHISSSGEYEELVWKSKGKTIYSCKFEVTYKDINVTVIADFETKRLNLQVKPDIDREQKMQLVEFFEILTEPDYYEAKEMEEIQEELHIPEMLRRLAIAAWVLIFVTAILELANLIPSAEGMVRLLNLLACLFMALYYAWVAIKKKKLKQQRNQKK